jgi:hypothetical protein
MLDGGTSGTLPFLTSIVKVHVAVHITCAEIGTVVPLLNITLPILLSSFAEYNVTVAATFPVPVIRKRLLVVYLAVRIVIISVGCGKTRIGVFGLGSLDPATLCDITEN